MLFKNPFFFTSLLILFVSSKVQNIQAVINGEKAEAGEFPFIVDMRNGTDDKPFCEGTLVTRSHIVTAVYCITTTEHYATDEPPTFLPLEDIKVYIGSLGAREGKLYEVEKLVPHPEYNSSVSLALYNVAIIELKTEVDVKLASLPSTSPTVGQTVTTAGWGYTDVEREIPATELRKYTSKVVDKQHCKQKWTSLGEDFQTIYDYIETDKVFCAVPDVNGSGGGFGDMASPAVVDGQYMGFPLMTRFDDKTVPEIFVAIAAYKDFITKNINKK